MKEVIRKIIVILLFIIITSGTSFADVGSFESYDSGSSWSSSSSSSDWGSSSSYDWGGSSSSWWDSDYDSSYSGGGGFDLGGFFIFLLVIGAIEVGVIIASKYNKKHSSQHSNINKSNAKPSISYNNVGVINLIKQVDPNFSRVKFESYAKEVFIKLQNAWTDRDWEKIRPFETAELFEQHKMQLDGYIKNNQINVMDRICVRDVNFISFEQTTDKDILKIDLDSRMSDYIIDATTKQVIKGNKEIEYYNTYTMTFVRAKGSITQTAPVGINTINCPNCGAPTTVTSAGRCQYCNSVIVTNDHGWILANLTRRS